MKSNNIVNKLGLVIGLLVASGAAMAQSSGGIDLSAVTAAIAVGVAAIGTIGVAVLGVRAAVATYSWVRQAIK
ncbi:major capsid protein [Cupriavidus plantarum]|uniref:major capsid protein n=1 Tax=Cupriavidus plantarum TaxID=942865 RepID=UPI0015C988D8|nr:major capsid protein [Cupriavidus plantarum]NYI00232.1 ABC-type uncharacterized transport system permease subunit [Cupriavidus plantarum]